MAMWNCEYSVSNGTNKQAVTMQRIYRNVEET